MAVVIFMLNLNLAFKAFKFTTEVPSFVIHSDNKDEKVTAVLNFMKKVLSK